MIEDLWRFIGDLDEIEWDEVEAALARVVVGPYLAERDGEIVPIEGYSYFRESARVEYLDVPTHVADLSDASALLWAAEMRDQGVKIEHLASDVRSMLTPEFLDQGRVWYPEALDVAAEISKDSGMELDRVVTAIAVMSPRCQWEDPESGEGEKKYVRSLAKFVAAGGTDGLTADEAAVAWKKHYKETNTVLGLVKGKRTGDPVGASVFNNNTAKAIRVMRGEVTPGELLIDNKTRSFYDNILFPQDAAAVTIDTHMMKVFERVYGVTYKDADVFTRHDRKIPKGGGQVRGVGYIALSEAIRQVASETGETPNTIQAAYWLRMQSEPHILENGNPWPGRDPVMAFARALDYLDTDFELRPAYSPEEVALNRLTDEEVEEVLAREQEEADRYERSVGLARVDVERYLRLVKGKVQDVESYHYRREAEPEAGESPSLPKMMIGGLLPEDQKIVRAMLPRLLARYPSVADQILVVKGVYLKTRWGSLGDDGTMKLTTLAAKVMGKKNVNGDIIGQEARGDVADTVSHEFGHALLRDLAGASPTASTRKKIKDMDVELRKLAGRGAPRFGSLADERNQAVRDLNRYLSQEELKIRELVNEVHGRVADAFDHDATRIHDQIVSEFSKNPTYYLSSKEELFAAAFAHYELGKRGPIADIVGEWVREKYGKVETP
jgi:hypothetical protein